MGRKSILWTTEGNPLTSTYCGVWSFIDSTWLRYTLPSGVSVGPNELRKIHGTNNNDIWVGGREGSLYNYLAHWDGNNWN
jgi:hypothetical protein